jgi:hypothetical protein
MRTMTFEDLKELLASGIPIGAIASVCPAPTRIAFEANTNNRRYRPAPNGDRAHIFPAVAADPGRPDLIEADDPRDVIWTGCLVDLVAVSIKR